MKKTLRLKVSDKLLEWELLGKKPSDEDYHTEDKGTARHELLDGTTKDTISLLVTLQRWLGDAADDRTLVDDRVSALKDKFSDLTRVLGQTLYSAIFTGKPEEKDKALDQVLLEQLNELDAEDLLRVQLQFDGDKEEEWSSWPWEYMYIPHDKNRPSTGKFLLAENAQLVLVRRIDIKGKKIPDLQIPQPVKVLLVCAAPRDLGPVDYNSVHKKIKELERAGAIELYELIEPRFEKTQKWHPTATFSAFQKKVRAIRPHVIHFIGHGRLKERRGELAFVGPDKPDWHSNFADAATESTELRLVFLQACDSALPDPHTPMSGVARQCAHKNIPAVVAMQAKVNNTAANAFTCNFYQTLAGSSSVDYAVLQARHELKAHLDDEIAAAFGVPVLYLRSYEKFLIPKPGPAIKNISEEGRESFICPRCTKIISRAEPKVCPFCKLAFCCSACGHRLSDPIESKACDECGVDFEQKVWQAAEVYGIITESVEESPLYQTLIQSGAQLSRSPAPNEMKVPHPTSFQNKTAES